jgi:hypothetical protein
VVRFVAPEADLPPSAACIDCPHSAKLPELPYWGRTDDQNTIRSRQLSCPLVEDQEKLDLDVGGIFQQIRTVRGFVRKSSQRHPDGQAGNFTGLKLVGADRHKGGFSERQPLFGVGSPKEILEPLLGKSRFLCIWSCRHKSIVIRTERCARWTRMVCAGSASQTDQQGKKERAFHRAKY